MCKPIYKCERKKLQKDIDYEKLCTKLIRQSWNYLQSLKTNKLVLFNNATCYFGAREAKKRKQVRRACLT